MGNYFGTDGVRGVANKDITPELAMQIGIAGAYVLAGQLGRQPDIIVGTDTRISSDMLEAAITAGLCSLGAKVHSAGVIPSPAISHLIRQYKMDAGVMLSASHNPMADNGIKFFDSTGHKLSDTAEDEIESYFGKNIKKIPRPTGENVGVKIKRSSALTDYADFLQKTCNASLEGMKIAMDCANGACSQIAPEIFKRMGAEVYPIHCKPDGININKKCGSTNMASLVKHVHETAADIGLAFDGDGDRVLAVDDKGAAADGDLIMAVCGLSLKNKGLLKKNSIVVTVMSNLGLQFFCDKNGIELRRTAVGDRYVVQEMIQGGYNFGGEQSGHILYYDCNTTGDGILTGLRLLADIKESGQKLSELRKIMTTVPQVLLGVRLGKRLSGDVCENNRINSAILEIEKSLDGIGRILVRPSGTEPLIRVMIEGPDKDKITAQAKSLISLIEDEFNK